MKIKNGSTYVNNDNQPDDFVPSTSNSANFPSAFADSNRFSNRSDESGKNPRSYDRPSRNFTAIVLSFVRTSTDCT